MKRFLTMVLVMSMILTLAACSRAEEVVVEERAKAVKVMEVNESENPVTLSYIGTVDSKDIINYGFKSGGKLGSIFVENRMKPM